MIRTRTSVPKVCVDIAKLADEVISRLTRNQRAHCLSLWSFRSPMGQRRSPAMRLTEPPIMTTPNRYDSKACDSTARRIRGSRTVVSDTW